MNRTVYHISKMNCPSEENLIHMKLDGVEGIRKLEFDIENRNLFVFHSGENPEITQRLESLKLGANLVATATIVFLVVVRGAIRILKLGK